MVYGYQNSINNTAPYMVSGYPWVTCSTIDPAGTATHKISFPNVSKSFTVIFTSGSSPLFVFFGPDPTSEIPQQVTNGHYISIPSASSSFTFNTRCAHFFVASQDTGSYQIFAELTSIEDNLMFILTGSGIDE